MSHVCGVGVKVRHGGWFEARASGWMDFVYGNVDGDALWLASRVVNLALISV